MSANDSAATSSQRPWETYRDYVPEVEEETTNKVDLIRVIPAMPGPSVLEVVAAGNGVPRSNVRYPPVVRGLSHCITHLCRPFLNLIQDIASNGGVAADNCSELRRDGIADDIRLQP